MRYSVAVCAHVRTSVWLLVSDSCAFCCLSRYTMSADVRYERDIYTWLTALELSQYYFMFKAAGMDEVVCFSLACPYAMDAWRTSLGAAEADGDRAVVALDAEARRGRRGKGDDDEAVGMNVRGEEGVDASDDDVPEKRSRGRRARRRKRRGRRRTETTPPRRRSGAPAGTPSPRSTSC